MKRICTIRESVSGPRHTHTHTHNSVYCLSLHGDVPGFHIREPASPLHSRKVSWKPAEAFLRPVHSWQLKLFNQHGDVISCSWSAWSFQEPKPLTEKRCSPSLMTEFVSSSLHIFAKQNIKMEAFMLLLLLLSQFSRVRLCATP